MLNKNALQRELNSGLSLSEICERDGLVYANVYYWCKKNGVKISRANNGKSSKTLSSRKKSCVFNDSHKDELFDLYITQQLPLSEISARFSTTDATVAATLRRFGIPVRLKNGKDHKVKPTQPKSVLEQLYITQQLSTHEIAKLLGYKHHGQVVEEMKYYNIDRRSYREAGTLLYEKHPEKRDLHRDQFYAGITGPKKMAVTSLEQKFMDWAVNSVLSLSISFKLERTGIDTIFV